MSSIQLKRRRVDENPVDAAQHSDTESGTYLGLRTVPTAAQALDMLPELGDNMYPSWLLNLYI